METKAIKQPKHSRKYYAIMTIIGAALTLMCTGGGIYGVSNMMVIPMAEKFGVEVSVTQLYYTMFLIGVITGGFFGPPIVAKLGLNGSAILGGVLGFIGLIMMRFAPSVPIFYIGAVFTGWPICFAGPALLQTAISKWFYTGRATIIGCVCMAEAVGTTIISTTTAKMLETSAGLSGALIVSGLFVLIGNLIAGLLCFKGSPEDYGFVAVGAENMPISENGEFEVPGITRGEAFKKPHFWAFLLSMSIINLAYGCVQPQLSTYTQFCGYTAAQAAVIVSVWSWAKSGSKIVYGFLADKFGLGLGLAIAAAFALVTGIIYIYTTSYGVLILCAIGIGVIGGLTGSGTLGVSRMCGQKDLLKMALLPHGFSGAGNIFGPIIFAAVFTGGVAGYRIAGWVSVAFIALYIVDVLWAGQDKHLFESGDSFKTKK